MRDSETTVNMAFTLDQSIASWIERRALSEDMNKSQLARKIFVKLWRLRTKLNW